LWWTIVTFTALLSHRDRPCGFCLVVINDKLGAELSAGGAISGTL
jgi:hypothetical protein